MVDRLQREYAGRVTVMWKAFELRPEPVPVPAADTPARRERWDASVLPMAAERGLMMRVPPVAVRTRLAFQAAELARDHQKFDAMHRALFEAYFRDGRDIGDAGVLASIAESVELAPALVARVLAAGTYLRRVVAQERLAQELGVDGVPAMLVGDDPEHAEPVVGAAPYAWVRDAVERGLAGAWSAHPHPRR